MIPAALKGAWFLGFGAVVYLLSVSIFEPELGKMNILESILLVIILSGLTLIANVFSWHLDSYGSTIEHAGRLARQLLRYFFFPTGILAILGTAVAFLITGNDAYLMNAGLLIIFVLTVLVGGAIFVRIFRIPGVDYL